MLGITRCVHCTQWARGRFQRADHRLHTSGLALHDANRWVYHRDAEGLPFAMATRLSRCFGKAHTNGREITTTAVQVGAPLIFSIEKYIYPAHLPVEMQPRNLKKTSRPRTASLISNSQKHK